MAREKTLQIAQKKDWFRHSDFQNQLIRTGKDEVIRYTVRYFQSRNNKSWKENYLSLIEGHRKNIPIYIDQIKIRSIVISS